MLLRVNRRRRVTPGVTPGGLQVFRVGSLVFVSHVFDADTATIATTTIWTPDALLDIGDDEQVRHMVASGAVCPVTFNEI